MGGGRSRGSSRNRGPTLPPCRPIRTLDVLYVYCMCSDDLERTSERVVLIYIIVIMSYWITTSGASWLSLYRGALLMFRQFYVSGLCGLISDWVAASVAMHVLLIVSFTPFSLHIKRLSVFFYKILTRVNEINIIGFRIYWSVLITAWRPFVCVNPLLVILLQAYMYSSLCFFHPMFIWNA